MSRYICIDYMFRSPRIIASIFIATLMVGIAMYIRLGMGNRNTLIDTLTGETIGGENEAHAHAQLFIFIGGELFDLGAEKYMERDTRVHLHDNNGTAIHIHTEGITLPFFFQTLGMILTVDCFTPNTETTYCTNATGTLSVLINKERVNKSLDTYVIQNYDKILINYGTDTPLDLQLKFNAIPDLGSDY